MFFAGFVLSAIVLVLTNWSSSRYFVRVFMAMALNIPMLFGNRWVTSKNRSEQGLISLLVEMSGQLPVEAEIKKLQESKAISAAQVCLYYLQNTSTEHNVDC